MARKQLHRLQLPATLVSSHQSPEQEVVRVDIEKAGTQTGWRIQLNQAPLKVESNHRYSLSFRVRADRIRNDVWVTLYQRQAPKHAMYSISAICRDRLQ
jgi:Carbohydrate binding domain